MTWSGWQWRLSHSTPRTRVAHIPPFLSLFLSPSLSLSLLFLFFFSIVCRVREHAPLRNGIEYRPRRLLERLYNIFGIPVMPRRCTVCDRVRESEKERERERECGVVSLNSGKHYALDAATIGPPPSRSIHSSCKWYGIRSISSARGALKLRCAVPCREEARRRKIPRGLRERIGGAAPPLVTQGN